MGVSRFSVAMGIALVLSVTSASAAPGEKDQKAGAQKTFDAGSKLFDGHHYEEALAAFRASYQIVPSPNSHLMVARCLRELGRNAEAYREYDAVASEAAAKGERYDSAKQAATDERGELKTKVALLTVTVVNPPAGVTVRLGDAALDPGKLGTPLPLDPGAVVVSAQAPDGTSARADVKLEAGATPTVALTLVAPAANQAPAPAPAPAPVTASASADTSGVPLRTWAYVAGGIGVAGAATFVIFGAMSNSKFSSLEDSCPDHRCPPDKQGDIDSGRTMQTVANVGLIVGAVGIGAGTTLFLLGGKHGQEEHASRDVRVSIGPASFSVKGAF